jgi:HlyD family secretion protein
MIKNAALLVLGSLSLAACGRSDARGPEPFQGIIEHEDRVLAFEVSGRIAAVDVVKGDEVAAGDELATLDARLAEIQRASRAAELEAARARLALLEAGSRSEDIRATRAELEAAKAGAELARTELARYRALETSGATTASALDRASAEVAQAEGRVASLTERLRAQRAGARSQEIDAAVASVRGAEQGLAGAERHVAQHRLIAPLNGAVLDLLHHPGEALGANVPVLSMADLDHPYVDVFVPQEAIDRVPLDARAQVRVDAYDEAFDGRVEHIADHTEFTPRFLFSERERPNLVVRVRIAIDDPEHRLVAGVPAFATVEAP